MVKSIEVIKELKELINNQEIIIKKNKKISSPFYNILCNFLYLSFIIYYLGINGVFDFITIEPIFDNYAQYSFIILISHIVIFILNLTRCFIVKNYRRTIELYSKKIMLLAKNPIDKESAKFIMNNYKDYKKTVHALCFVSKVPYYGDKDKDIETLLNFRYEYYKEKNNNTKLVSVENGVIESSDKGNKFDEDDIIDMIKEINQDIDREVVEVKIFS